MGQDSAVLLNFPKNNKSWKRNKLNLHKKGSVYDRSGKLYVYFSYMQNRVREPSGLVDTLDNRKKLRLFLDKIAIEIAEESFIFADYFPYSKKKAYFTELEGRNNIIEPKDITFGDYWKKWFNEMQASMSISKRQDYTKIVDYYLLPYFKDMTFADFRLITMKKFVAHLSGMKNRFGNPLLPSTINNIFIPLRGVTADAFAEYEFSIPDPFVGLKMPKRQKTRVNPLTFDEFGKFISVVNPWYAPYFEFAVTTGLRPSEQVALKWSAISDDYIEIELSRVKGYEKKELKTESSKRSIENRPAINDILERQRKLSARFNSEYVFVNLHGRVINQDKMRQLWERAEKKAGLSHRRMYELRHTFASWALAAGEQPGWVAKTLGHTDLTMVYSVYARYIPDLKKNDGGKFETLYTKKHLK